jgi:hypothetical protein
MRASITGIALLLLTLWVPATSHCLMERAGMIPIAGCCAKSLGDCSQNDCATGCGAVESTLTKASTQTPNVSLPPLVITQLLPPLTPQASTQIALGWLFWPPDNFTLAEFLAHRTLPVRAPSHVA